MNVAYDQNIKTKWRNLLCSLLIVMTLIILLLTEDYSVKYLLVKVILPLVPMFKFVYDKICKINNSISNLKKLRENIENKLKSLSLNDVIDEKCLRNIQDMIFRNRVSNPLIPDFIYRYFWIKLEDEMNYNVEKKIDELK